MERLKRLFPTLATWPGVKLAMLPIAIIWNVLVFGALLHYLIWPNDLPTLY